MVTLNGQPGHGTATVVGTRIAYTSEIDFSGDDSFSYTASDGKGGSATAAVTVIVIDSDNPTNPEEFIYLSLIMR